MINIDVIQNLASKLCSFSKKRFGFAEPPKLFFKKDQKNSADPLGKTAFYSPAEKSITIFISGRHPKDILRSLSHELIHHHQNLRGDLSPDKCGQVDGAYAQNNQHLRNMEKEAYLLGNMCFRDWEDSHKFNITESKFLKENKKMEPSRSVKISKKMLKEMISKILLKEDPRAGQGSGLADAAAKERENVKMDEFDVMRGEFVKGGQKQKKAPQAKLDMKKFEKLKSDIDRLIGKIPAISKLLNPKEPTGWATMLKVNPKSALMSAAAAISGPAFAQGEGTTMGDTAVRIESTRNGIHGVLAGIVAAYNAMKPEDKEKYHGAIDKELKNFRILLMVMGKDAVAASEPGHVSWNEGGILDVQGAVNEEVTPEEDIILEDEVDSGDCGCTDLDGTPERENNLYESRFGPRNDRLFSRLMKEWVK